MSIQQIERDFKAAIRAAYATGNTNELYYAMTYLAEAYITRDWTQTASNILAFVLLQVDVDSDSYDLADELFDDLERRICPRVILDAKTFAQEITLTEMIAYVLDNKDDDSC